MVVGSIFITTAKKYDSKGIMRYRQGGRDKERWQGGDRVAAGSVFITIARKKM